MDFRIICYQSGWLTASKQVKLNHYSNRSIKLNLLQGRFIPGSQIYRNPPSKNVGKTKVAAQSWLPFSSSERQPMICGPIFLQQLVRPYVTNTTLWNRKRNKSSYNSKVLSSSDSKIQNEPTIKQIKKSKTHKTASQKEHGLRIQRDKKMRQTDQGVKN